MNDKNFMSYGDAETVFTEFADNINSKEPQIFKGTVEEWNALTATEQAKYSVKMITDDETGATVDAVIDGDMRAVTSNAVYSALNAIGEVQVKAISLTGNQTRTMTFSIESNKSYTYSAQEYSDTDGYHSYARIVRSMSSSDYDNLGVVKLQWAKSDTTATLSIQNTGAYDATLTVFVTKITNG